MPTIKYEINAVLESIRGGVFIPFSYDAVSEFGKSWVTVECTIDGEP